MQQSTEFKVGLLVIGIALLITYMTIGVSEDPSYLGRAKHYWFHLSDATGLVENSSVKIAGINVGVIKKIELQNGVARIDITLSPDVVVTEVSKIEIRAQGILGDRYIEVVPVDTSAPLLENGGQIKVVQNKGSFDAIMNEMSQIAANVNEVADSLKKSLVEGDDSTRLGRIVGNLETLTADLAELSAEKKDEIKDIIDNLETVTAEVKALVSDPSEEGFKASFEKFNRGIARVDVAMKNIEEITDKINSGKGTLGKLINDEKTVEELNTAIQGVSEFVGTATKTTTHLDFRSEYLADISEAKTYLGVRIQPGLDRYYEIQIVDDPKGVVNETTTETTTGGSTTVVEEKKTYKNRVKLTALFAKNFYDFTFKAGLMENTGGVGIEYHIIPKRMRFVFDAFDFGEDAPHLRAALRYSLLHGFYLIGGADNFISDNGEESAYIGAGLDLSNDDLKLFLSRFSF